MNRGATTPMGVIHEPPSITTATGTTPLAAVLLPSCAGDFIHLVVVPRSRQYLEQFPHSQSVFFLAVGILHRRAGSFLGSEKLQHDINVI